MLKGKTALVTGSTSGIGLAVARALAKDGANIMINGFGDKAAIEQERAALEKDFGVKARYSAADMSKPAEIAAMVAETEKEFGSLDVLVNNAGIQRRVRLTAPEPWAETRQELAINLDAPIHLSLALLTHLVARSGIIINVTSGLSFAPYVAAPVYSATKAALHSFTMSLRHQLAETGVRVVEIIPPAVNTDLGGVGLHTGGAPLRPFADEVVARLAAGEEEIAYGTAQPRAAVAHAAFDEIFARMNGKP